MADVNTVVIISDKQELINQISSKLVLLRNLDKIKSCSIEEAQNMFDGFSPNVIILHCDNNRKASFFCIKEPNHSDSPIDGKHRLDMRVRQLGNVVRIVVSLNRLFYNNHIFLLSILFLFSC